jgi:hypothetical protein
MTGLFWVHPEQAASVHLAKKKCKSLAYDLRLWVLPRIPPI